MQNSKLQSKIQNFRKTPYSLFFILYSRSGFTLIEILVAVAIIGVLSSLLMTNYIGIRQRARDVQRKADLRQIQSALEIYRADIGTYPTSASLANCPAAAPAGLGNSDCSTTYMQKVPSDPLVGSYTYSSNGSTYSVIACLENNNGADSTNVSPCDSLLRFSYTLQNP